MTWDPDRPYRPEVQKCRDRLLPYCIGFGLDLGCGREKIKPDAIGLDSGGAADIRYDLSSGVAKLFQPGQFDFVFSSHALEDFHLTEHILRDWWTVLRVGGDLVMYLPHADLYPRVGTPGANPSHRHDFYPQDVIRHLHKFAVFAVVREEVHAEDDEYSFELVVRKLASAGRPRKRVKVPTKAPRALVIRYGAFGDHIFASALFPLLKRDGFHVTYNTNERGVAIAQNNPHIDEFLLQEENVVDLERLGDYWEALGKDYDKVVNLTGTCENKFLFHPSQAEYKLPDAERRALVAGSNYYRHVCEVAGYPGVKNSRGRLYPSPMERSMHQLWRKKLGRNVFVVIWCLSGSGPHKLYPTADVVQKALLDRYADMVIITMGDADCQVLEFEHPRLLAKSGRMGIRDSLLLTQYADLVVSPETAVLNAAGCFEVPKIGLLTHSSREQLCGTWLNDHSLQAATPCSPCHKLVYPETFAESCPLLWPDGNDEDGNFCACADAFPPDDVFRAVERVYLDWHRDRGSRPKVLGGLMAVANG